MHGCKTGFVIDLSHEAAAPSIMQKPQAFVLASEFSDCLAWDGLHPQDLSRTLISQVAPPGKDQLVKLDKINISEPLDHKALVLVFSRDNNQISGVLHTV